MQKVLIVERWEIVRNFLVTSFHEAGWGVVATTTEEDALRIAMISDRAFDLVVAGMHLENMRPTIEFAKQLGVLLKENCPHVVISTEIPKKDLGNIYAGLDALDIRYNQGIREIIPS